MRCEAGSREDALLSETTCSTNLPSRITCSALRAAGIQRERLQSKDGSLVGCADEDQRYPYAENSTDDISPDATRLPRAVTPWNYTLDHAFNKTAGGRIEGYVGAALELPTEAQETHRQRDLLHESENAASRLIALCAAEWKDSLVGLALSSQDGCRPAPSLASPHWQRLWQLPYPRCCRAFPCTLSL